MTPPLFIASPVSVLTGDAARVALAQTNDAAHYTVGKGVLSVPLERWQKAQEYERATWLNQGLSVTEDRNSEHAAHFGDYKSLPQNLGAVIELGCGPFTNLIHILPTHTAEMITLLDPLAREYLEYHPHCTYKTLGPCVDIVPYPIEEYEAYAWLNGKPIPAFDTIVMINVLSHCQSVDMVCAWINDHLREGGYLVFHEPARDIDPLEMFDIGHPLSYTQAVIDEFLTGYTEVYRKGDYFIGRKK